MLEQATTLIAKARRFAAMDDADLMRQSIKTLLGDLAQALEESERKRLAPSPFGVAGQFDA